MGPMSAMTLFSSVLVFVFCVLVTVDAASCPEFALPQHACRQEVCGQYRVQGRFRESLQHRLDGTKFGLTAASPKECCSLCKSKPGCAYWNHFKNQNSCYLYRASVCATKSEEAFNPDVPFATAGSHCQAQAQIKAAAVKAITSKLGAKDKLKDKAFCLLTDQYLHINMLLSGYYDNRTEGASTIRNGKAIRTWIREIGIMWTKDRMQHSLRIIARRGAENARGDGYVERIEVDGTIIPRLVLGDELNLYDGEASVMFDSYEKSGQYDVDLYRVRIEGVFEADLRLRVAHPLLQTPDDAQVHINLDILDVQFTPSVHGVLGQSYRDDSLERALNYSLLAELMHLPGARAAVTSFERSTSEGFVSSEILTPDCGYSQYRRAAAALPAV